MANLELFRELASLLATREKKQIGILTDKGTVTAIYDPLFKTVSFGGMTVPEKELGFWMKAVYGATVKKIVGVE
ncbi:MAG: hypothetical protein ABSB94_00580 [Syntrophorhabdales bacterium]|jgi:hypothetical protein